MELDIDPYIKDRNIKTLQTILSQMNKVSYYIEMGHLNQNEAELICRAMIRNPHFTVICSATDGELLQQIFAGKGYTPSTCLKSQNLLSQATQRKVIGYLFYQKGRKAA